MKIRLHIERVVFDALPVPVSERPLILAAMESSLTQLLLQNGGLSDELRAGAALGHMRGGTIQVGKDRSSNQIGRDLAHAVSVGLGRSQSRQIVTAGRKRPAVTQNSLRRGIPNG